jgi:uncharacterized protein (TIGR03083 family)
MPPASKPLSADLVGACMRQWSAVADAVATLADSDFERPTRLPGWTVVELARHVARCAEVLALRAAEPPPAARGIELPQYLLNAPSAAAAIAERESVGPTEPAVLRDDVRAGVARLITTAEQIDPERLVASRFGGLRAGDMIASRVVEGLVHGLDLRAAVPGLELVPDPEAVKVVTKVLLQTLAAKAPGRSVEVRVPPVAAVQCVEGPRHTRGTPPNVVEADPLTWIEVAAGRLSWRDAAENGRLRASGERSDISNLLPLI